MDQLLDADHHHHHVCIDLKHLDLSDLVRLGGALGLSHPRCNRFSNVGDFVSSWLRKDDNVLDHSGKPTWGKLADALEEIGHTGIARDIRSKHAEKVQQASRNVDQSSSSSADGHSPQNDTGRKRGRSSSSVIQGPSLSPETKEDLSQRIHIETNAMKHRFSSLQTKIRNNIKKNVSPEDLASHIIGMYILSEEHKKKMENASKIEDVFNILTMYWSFLDFSHLENIADVYCSQDCDAKKELGQYKEEVRRFCERRVSELPPDSLNNGTDIEGMDKLVVTLDLDDPSLRHVLRLKEVIANILGQPASKLVLCNIESGSVKVTFWMTTSLGEELFSNKSRPFTQALEEKLQEAGVISLEFKGIIVYQQFKRRKLEKFQGMRFGQRPPPISKMIKDLLRRYPNGQIFKELIQNADDAGATVVQFYIDNRRHQATTLPNKNMSEYQGPALIVANDGMFSEQDWEGIQRLQNSVKADDPFRVGKFGIGFNSVYHITDVPSIVSGDRIAYLDPQEKMWPGKPGMMFALDDLLCTDALLPFNGIESFDYYKTAIYSKTLFRFPLRNKPSDISKNTYCPESVIELTDILKDEANFLLLFLQSVHTIAVKSISGKGTCKLHFQVKISSNLQESVTERRRLFLSNLRDAHKLNPYTISPCISDVVNVSIEINSQQLCETKSWLIANQVGSINEAVLKAAAEQHTFPWVGVAIELREDDTLSIPFNGRVFCFLPLPIEVASTLPVHVHGTFGLNDDRRAIKWPEDERRDDPTALWNQMLVRDCLPSCYNLLLKKAVEDNVITPKHLYSILPDINVVEPSHFNSVLEHFYSSLFQWKWLNAMACDDWVDIQDATITTESDEIPEVVLSVLVDCGRKVVKLPDQIGEALIRFSSSFTTVSQAILRDELKDNLSKYSKKPHKEKLELLKYCLNDEMYSDLDGIELIPLADKTFQKFINNVEDEENYIYLCSEDFPRKILPNCDHRLIDLTDPSLQTYLLDVAHSHLTQLINLDENYVSALLPQCYPANWKDNEHVVELFNESQTFPIEWFGEFWKWIQKYSLSLFKTCFIIPIATESTDQRMTVARLTNRANSPVVLIASSECSNLMLNTLKKFKILCTMTEYVPYLMHRELHEYVNGYSPNGILNAISSMYTNALDIKLNENEAFELQRFLASLSQSQLDLTDSQRTVLFNLQIFEVVNKKALMSLQQASESSWNGSVIVEPPIFSISQKSLPECLVILSRNNEEELVNACSSNGLKVSLPKSKMDFIFNEIIPLINSKKCPENNIDSLMEQVLYLIPVLKREYSLSEFYELTSKLSRLNFLRIDESSTRKAPQDLYDYSIAELRALFQGKSVFPRSPFVREEHLQVLRECNLQTSAKGYVILSLVSEIAIKGSYGMPQNISNQQLSQAKAILSYLEVVPEILDENVSFEGKVDRLKHTLKQFSNNNCWLPICATPPDKYFDSLPWKGRACTSHVASISESILLWSSQDLRTIPHLVGSQMYIVECPQALCKVLQTSAVPCKAIFSHFKLIIENQRDINNTDLNQFVKHVYKHLQDNLSAFQHAYETSELCTQNIIWWKSQHKFVAPNRVVLKKHPTFECTTDLSPYYIPLPGNLSQYERLLIHFGVNKQLTDSNIISVLTMIKEDKQRTSNEQMKQKWKTMENILNWLTNEGTEDACDKLARDDTLLVPVDSKDLFLMDVKEVVYTDLDYLKSFTYDDNSSVHFIHDKFTHLAPYLGVKSLSSHLNISLDAFGDVGQHEPLVTRIKNILKDYQGGLTIIKELIQNADDAGATEMTICYDRRSHSVSPNSLIFPGMAKCHGPALLVHNNATFTDEDFENITKLAGATKMDKPLKIGKFGVGFCSVYHITDIPSFISRQWLYIFDPMITHLKKEIADKLRPGKKVLFTERIVQSSKQLIPYQNMFGFDQTKLYEGTLFRFPFRTSTSEISDIIYNKNEVDKLLNDLLNTGSRLLLFVNNLQSITFTSINNEDDKPKILYSLKKSVLYQVPLSDSAITDETVKNDNCVFQIEVGNFLMEKDKRTHFTSNYWLISNFKQQSGSEHGKPHSSSVACLLHQHGNKNYSPQQISGEIFCYLPLSLKSGLPVHVSANFAVRTDRSGIHSSDDDGSPSDQAQWNVSLMQNAIPRAYFSMLLALKELSAQQKISMQHYEYYSLWPLEEDLKRYNPWNKLISQLYQLITFSTLLYSPIKSQWLELSSAHILEPRILSVDSDDQFPARKCVIEAAKELEYSVTDLPVPYQKYLPVKSYLVNEEQFLERFFHNIQKVSTKCRNDVLFLTLKMHTLRSNKNEYLGQHLKNRKCIPSLPDGTCIKMCSDIVDPSAFFACLYDESDEVFPLIEFHKDPLVYYSMKALGIIAECLPLSMIVERAKTIALNDEKKAFIKICILLQCLTLLISRDRMVLNGENSEIASVEFLPVMARPTNYPKCFDWLGERVALTCGKDIIKGASNSLVAGSQVCILNESEPENGGCGQISYDTAVTLKISSQPRCSLVIKHLNHIQMVYSQAKNKGNLMNWVESACEQIYKHFDNQLSQNQISADDLKELQVTESIWTGKTFILPQLVAKSWRLTEGPYLYGIPHLLKAKENLVSILELKLEFSAEDFLEALKQIYAKYKDKPIAKDDFKVVLAIANELSNFLSSNNTKLAEDCICYLPDTQKILRNTSELAYNDAPWCPIDMYKDNIIFVNDKVSRAVATELGVSPVRSKVLQQYESAEQYWEGVPFGQHEELTQRIKNILKDYPLGITVLKELLQNADDAKATKMYVLLDKRMHGVERLPSTEWQDLQGPALLVWNDSVFSEEDLKGIQELGLGSKRSDPETIGQFGIGFNVVYNLTDCPSFISGGTTLCVFDPHCRYVSGATVHKPGRRYEVDDAFWMRWRDLQSAYLHQGTLLECPREVQNSGTLFRFPLRHTPELVQKSNLINNLKVSNWTSSKLTVKQMENDAISWFHELKEAILFLNHVTELKLFLIDQKSTIALSCHFEVQLDAAANDKRNIFFNTFQNFLQNKVPYVVHFPVLLMEHVPNKEVKKWIIQLGVGDFHNPQQQWYKDVLHYKKPRHSLALPFNAHNFSGRLFCFLPLLSPSNLPVHVNGDFMLDSARSGLWKPRGSPNTDKWYQWNHFLLEAIASSYTELLKTCRTDFFSFVAGNQSLQEVNAAIAKYYSIFPKWMEKNIQEGEIKILVDLVYSKLSILNFPILILHPEITVDTGQQFFSAKWLPLTDIENSSEQVYFLDSRLQYKQPRILKMIGMNTTAAPLFVRNHLKDCGTEIPIANSETVFHYYSNYYVKVSKTFPCPIAETKFQSVENFIKFVQYILQVERSEEKANRIFKFPMPPDNIPLLLTYDESLCRFSEDNKVISSEFATIFGAESGKKFLHPQMYKLRLTADYFVEPSYDNWAMISSILFNTLPECLTAQQIENASDHVNTKELLMPLWKCLMNDKVFKFHSYQIIREWALLLTTRNEMFAHKSDNQLLPIIPQQRPTSRYHQSEKEYEVFKILEQHGMSVLDKTVVDVDFCVQFCPNMGMPEKILRNLFHLYQQNQLQSLRSDLRVDNVVLTLFTYFKPIHFAYDEKSMSYIKSLPLFKDIRGKYCALKGQVYIWPTHTIPFDIGNGMWMEQTLTVFLNPEGVWKNLGNASELKLNELSPLLVYIKFIFPNFHLLSDDERFAHLELIRDNRNLFQRAWSASEDNDIREENRQSKHFINALKNVPCMLRKGKLQPVSQFCDPDVPIFSFFLDDDSFPPKELTLKGLKWLPFFRKLGLRSKATMEEFTRFCTKLAEEKQQLINKSSQVLLEYLFRETSWHSNVQFLSTISKIPFVYAEPEKDLDWISPVASAERRTYGQSSLSKAASNKVKNLIWTIKPVIYLPQLSWSHNEKQREEFFSCLKICVKPSLQEVVDNIKQISLSRFADFKLFDYSNKECIPSREREGLLSRVLIECFWYLKDNHCSKTDLQPLRNVPCIPVSSSDLSTVTVLVKPLQIVASTDSDGTIKQLIPFLNPLPCDLYSVLPDVLSKLGVTTEVHYGNLRNALEMMYKNIKQPLGPNSIKQLKFIFKKLYNTEIDTTAREPLYLSNEKLELVESTKLLYDDRRRYRKAQFDINQSSYSFISLLTTSRDERDEYGFSLKEFVGRLPLAVRPLPLSAHCSESLGSGCIPQEQSTMSELATRLSQAFRFTDFAKVIDKILHTYKLEETTCKQFTKTLTTLCNSMKVLSIPNLTVDIHLTVTKPPVKIGTAKIDFTFLHNKEDESFPLYLNAGTTMTTKLFESLASEIVSMVTKIGGPGVDSEEFGRYVEKPIASLLQGQSQDEIDDLLDEYGVSSFEVHGRDISYTELSVKLGSPIPKYLHHRLYADVQNIFRPQEFVGYELEENHYIFARVEYRISETDDSELDKYLITVSEDDEDGKEVTIIELCKILRMKEIRKEDGSREIVLYDSEAESVLLWDAVKDESLKSVLNKVYRQLKRIVIIKDKELRRKAIKSMYLKWHPDKNLNAHATKAFQYLQQQIQRMEQGLPVEDPNSPQTEGNVSCDHFWSSVFNQWDELSRSRSEYWKKEQEKEQYTPATPTEDFDAEVNSNRVHADPVAAQIWLKQAEHDLTALKILMREVNIKKEVCAHACFMAHQVAEKGLKAGMYKLIGLHPGVLRWHQLIGHASAIEQVKPQITSGLRAMVRTLESYYLDPRYPNRYSPVKVPSDQYTVEEAGQAERTANNVLNIIQKLF